MDLTNTIIPKSDQLNSDALIAGPRTFTISDVREGSTEQPANIALVEFPGRPFRPSKTVLRVLVTAWGKESSTYIGRRMTLYRDPDVKFGGQDVGGIRVSHLSDIEKPMKLALTVTRGKKATHIVQPLAAEPAAKRAVPAATDAQLKSIHAGLTGLNIKDRDAAMGAISQVIDREITSPTELTGTEAVTVLDWIEREKASEPADEPSGADRPNGAQAGA